MLLERSYVDEFILQVEYNDKNNWWEIKSEKKEYHNIGLNEIYGPMSRKLNSLLTWGSYLSRY